MNSLLGMIEIFYICLGGLLGFLFYSRYHLGVGVYVIIGIILGPAVLNLVSISYLSDTLSSIGILFVLFEIGLHLSYEKILLLKQYLFSSSMSIFLSILTVSGGLFLTRVVPNIYLLLSMLIGVSSTPIIYNLLQEKNKLYTKTGRFVFTIMLLQDILSIVLLINHTNNSSIFTTLFKTILVLLFLFLLGKKIMNKLLKQFSSSFEVIFLISFLLIIGLSLLTEHFGLSLELGAVLAGFLLAETDYSVYIESQIMPIKKVLLCVFFMTMGMYFPLEFLYNNLFTSLLLFIGIMTLKFIGLFLGGRLFFLNNLQAVTASLMLLSIGEVVFIFINKIFPSFSSTIGVEILNYLSIITVLSLIITPLLFHTFYYFYHTQMEKDFSEKKQFIIIGFNDVTNIVVRILEKYEINYLCIDNSLKVVNDNKKNGYHIVLNNYMDIKTLHPLLKGVSGVFFSTPPAVTLLQQIQNITKEKIYIKIKNAKEEAYYRDLNTIPICIDVYDEAFKVCSNIMGDFGIDEGELERIFSSID